MTESTSKWQKILCIELSNVVIPDLANIITEYVPELIFDEYERKGVRVFGLCQGTFVSFYDANHMNLKSRFVNGQLHGAQEAWYGNGQKSYILNYFNGQRHGVAEGWYSNGQQEYKRNYVNGHLHGTDEGWYVMDNNCASATLTMVSFEA